MDVTAADLRDRFARPLLDLRILRNGAFTRASLVQWLAMAGFFGSFLLIPLFLQQVRDAYPGVAILLLWDRATWHQGPCIRSVLEANPRLELMQFPPGCPELNPQEHVWKAARTAVSHNHGYTKLPQLADEFETYLTNTSFPCSLLERHAYDLISTLAPRRVVPMFN